MTTTVAVYRPHGRTWALYGFITLLLAFNSLFWFFDPGPLWVRFFGGAVLVYWAFVLVGIARARVELRENTIEIYGPAYVVLPSRQGVWLYGLLIAFVVWDTASLLFGPLPHGVNQARFVLSLVWLFAYFLNLLSQLPRGRRSVAYRDIETPPWEDDWGPYRKLFPRKGLFMAITNEPRAFQFPPWLREEDRSEIAGKVAARVKHAKAAAAPPAGDPASGAPSHD